MAGSQRYICLHCQKSYTPTPKSKKYSEEFRRNAIKIYLEGNSWRGEFWESGKIHGFVG
jgi:transposase-like protein